MDFKDIHIGKLIYQRMQECNVSVERASNFVKISEEEVEDISNQQSLDSAQLLAWCKLLEYDFFRIYCQHLILYAPEDRGKVERQKKTTTLPQFKKNIYSPELIRYLVKLIQEERMSTTEIQLKYNNPATTVFRWVDKYGKRQRKEHHNIGKNGK